MSTTDPVAASRPPRSRAARILRPFLLLSASGAVALVLAEVLLRVTGLAATGGSVFTDSARQFERVPGIFAPGQDRVIHENPDLPYRVRIDSLGYRGADVARTPSADELRILFVGDSGVFGSFVEDDETLPAQVEALLRGRCDDPVVVVNAGLGGSTIREHTPMVERGLPLQPDLVLLMFSENDVRDLMGPVMWDELAANRAAKSRFPLSVIYPLVRNSALWELALRVRAVAASRRIDSSLEGGDAATGPDAAAAAASAETERAARVEEARAEYRRLLGGLVDALGARGVPFAFAVFPSHLSVYERWDSDQLEWIDAVARELGLEPVSFLEAFRADGRPETELYLLPYDGHPSPEGYAVAARVLADALIRGGLPAGSCS